MWDRIRIDEEHKLRERFGLRNLKEVWIADSELRRIKKNIREVLAGRSSEEVGKQMVARLSKYSIVRRDATFDDLLVIDVSSILARRLQTIVASKGMAKSLNQSRQLITHGFISVNGRRVTSPGYLVTADQENKIGYYKKIDISVEAPAKQEMKAQEPKAEVKEAG